MTFGTILAATWSSDPSILGGCLALLTAYLAWTRGRPVGRALAFAAGVAVLWLSQESPLHVLGERYLFSAHMVQHLLLILIVPPLLLLGLPERPTLHLLRWRWLAVSERILGRPAVAFPAAVVLLYLWHVPALYDAALVWHGLHVVEHLVFLITWCMYWWPLLAPSRRSRLGTLPAIGYLAGALVCGSILGILLTFAPGTTYPFYVDPPDPFGYGAFFRQAWGLTRQVDQQIGGLFMWVPGGIVIIAAILLLFGRWITASDDGVGPATVQGDGAPDAEPDGSAPALGARRGGGRPRVATSREGPL